MAKAQGIFRGFPFTHTNSPFGNDDSSNRIFRGKTEHTSLMTQIQGSCQCLVEIPPYQHVQVRHGHVHFRPCKHGCAVAVGIFATLVSPGPEAPHGQGDIVPIRALPPFILLDRG